MTSELPQCFSLSINTLEKEKEIELDHTITPMTHNLEKGDELSICDCSFKGWPREFEKHYLEVRSIL